MKKAIALIVWCVVMALPSVAQNMKIEDFKLLENDLTANT